MKPRIETFRCYLKILSPVHVGCDEVYEPTSFVVNEHGKEGPEMFVFDPLEFISALTDDEKKRFSAICKEGKISSILEIYKFLKGKSANGKRVALCTGFMDHYKKVLGLKGNEREITQNLNKFEMKRTSFRSYDERPYIPGSAIKGALRTAYLNACSGNTRLQRPDNRNLQAGLMEYNPVNIETDPFRLVKVSDFQPVGDITTKIFYAINKKKKLSDREARGPYQILETLEAGAVFTGEISVEQPISDKYIKKPVNLEKLLTSCAEFYTSENSRERSELSKVNIKGITIEASGEIPVRIGRHSGAESITVADYRSIKIMKGRNERPEYLKQSTTFWLASETDHSKSNTGLKPFGWATFVKLSTDMEKELSAEEISYRRDFEMTALERTDTLEQGQAVTLAPNIITSVEQSPAELAEEKIESFSKSVAASKNISGDIQRFEPIIRNEQDPETRTRMCGILLEKALGTDRKKFRKSVREGKPWAVAVHRLCSENQVDSGAGE
jgi:CRISPR-associated protein Csm5